jgi:hypothetical protein
MSTERPTSEDNDDSAGLPEGFSYMTPPPGWPPPRSAEELRRMALRLQQHLESR